MTDVSQPAYSMGKGKERCKYHFIYLWLNQLPMSFRKSGQLVKSWGALWKRNPNTAIVWLRAHFDEVDSVFVL